MESGFRFALAVALLALPVGAGQRQGSFRVGAVVVRSAQVHAGVADSGAFRLRLAGASTVSVRIDSAQDRLVAANEIALPAGARTVTIHY